MASRCSYIGLDLDQLGSLAGSGIFPLASQVKSEDGQEKFILKLQYDDTIWSLRQCINEHRAKLAKEQGKPAPAGGYEIRSAFPARAYAEAKETLREAGLVPNATLYLK